LQALNRTHAAAGNLSSGNADADSIKFAQDQASKAYGQYGAGLAPYLQLQGQGQLAATAGQAGTATGLGAGLNASYMGQGAAGNANYTGQGAADAAATMNNYNVGANQLNALMGVANLASGGLGSGLGGALTGGFGGSGFAMGPTSVGGAPVSGGLFSMFQ
jgi:hypothetical protein